MIRDLNYSIRFGKGDVFMLTREMTQVQDPNEGLQEEFAIDDEHTQIRFAPEEFDLLHHYIHEMLRMHDQHRDALTNGAEQQPADPEPLLQTVCGDDVLGYVFSDKGRAVLAAQESDDD